MKNVISKSPLETSKHIINHSAQSTLVKRLKQNNAAKSEIISITSHTAEAGLNPYDSGDEKRSRLYPMQLIIVALNLFYTDNTSFQ